MIGRKKSAWFYVEEEVREHIKSAAGSTLREAGISQFFVISGVSVGALNAALIGMGDFELAKKLWVDLSPDRVIFNPGGERRITLFKVATAVLAAAYFPLCLLD